MQLNDQVPGRSFLIFTAMPNKRIKNIIILVFSLAVACFSTRKIGATPGAEQVKNVTLTNPAQQYPNGELERVQHPSAPGWNITAPKNLVPAALSQGAFVYNEQISFKSSVVKTSSLRVKDDLLYIHPSHHFW